MNPTYPEFMVAKVVGPKKSVLVQLRRTVLKKSVDWVLVNSVVHYTAAGIAAICRAMGLDHAAITDELKKILEPAEPESAASATDSTDAPATRVPRADVDIVVTGRSPNPQIVFGRLDEVPVKVRVRDNAHFLPGLVLTAKPSADGLFIMVGNPPRWRGDRLGFTRPAPQPQPTPA